MGGSLGERCRCLGPGHSTVPDGEELSTFPQAIPPPPPHLPSPFSKRHGRRHAPRVRNLAERYRRLAVG